MSSNGQHEDDQRCDHDAAQAPDASGPDDAEDLSDIPMFQEPRRKVGERDAQFSPAALYALTRHQRHDIDPNDDGLFLVEEAIDRIDKRGIPLGGEYYWSPGLQEHVTGSSDTATPNYVIRYDRARYARGILQEVLLYREEPDGRRRLVCRCKPREQAMDDLDHEEFLHKRGQYMKRLGATRSLAEHEVNMFQVGLKKYEKLLDKQAARRRRDRNRAPEPRPAAPISLEGDGEDPTAGEHEEELTFGEERARERQREQ